MEQDGAILVHQGCAFADELVAQHVCAAEGFLDAIEHLTLGGRAVINADPHLAQQRERIVRKAWTYLLNCLA